MWLHVASYGLCGFMCLNVAKMWLYGAQLMWLYVAKSGFMWLHVASCGFRWLNVAKLWLYVAKMWLYGAVCVAKMWL